MHPYGVALSLKNTIAHYLRAIGIELKHTGSHSQLRWGGVLKDTTTQCPPPPPHAAMYRQRSLPSAPLWCGGAIQCLHCPIPLCSVAVYSRILLPNNLPNAPKQ